MTVNVVCSPAPVGQQGPPTRVAAFDSWRSLRAARGPLLLTTGDEAISHPAASLEKSGPA